MKKVKKVKESTIEKIIGYIFIMPALIDAISLIMYVFGVVIIPRIAFQYDYWSVGPSSSFDDTNVASQSGPSMIPIYIGIMAIVGAYLIKSSSKRKCNINEEESKSIE